MLDVATFLVIAVLLAIIGLAVWVVLRANKPKAR